MTTRTDALPERTHWTPAEVASLLGVSERHIRGLCASGDIPAVRVGYFWRIPKAEYARFIEPQRTA